jgi:cytochrome P450
VQSRLRKEITEARDAARERGRRKREEGAGVEEGGSGNDVVVDEADGELDYDTLMGLPFLDAVVRETMRVYPPVPTVVRT